ncbi:MAG: permease [Chloroflexi bacterium]|nr:permease [Chloroflexota bacterium]MCI0578507.1 permease [Chloroflexota bacterium]MCI0648476.1 permease [Chloroflexota bacterium]MCI0726000.1 permease [Chloroflexota bacterium]
METTEQVTVAPAARKESSNGLRYLIAGLALVILLAILLPRLPATPLSQRFQTFVTIFLGIFIEAAPFLLAGSAVSGIIEEFVDRSALDRFIPRRALPAALAGAFLGLTFPVCECGVVPVTRRLYQKGLPLPVGVAFLLAAPVVNPIVILSTYAAFGWGLVLIGRLLFTILIAFAVALLFGLARPGEVLLPAGHLAGDAHHHDHDHAAGVAQPAARPAGWRLIGGRLWRALAIGGDDFLDMARYLVAGSMLAAAMQTVIPQSTLLALGRGPVISVVTLMLVAFVLSICSTVDAFVALSFTNTFTTGSILAFLTFGPMVDIKSSLMFLGVFRRRTVLYLVLLPLLFNLVIAIFVNLNLGW